MPFFSDLDDLAIFTAQQHRDLPTLQSRCRHHVCSRPRQLYTLGLPYVPYTHIPSGNVLAESSLYLTQGVTKVTPPSVYICTVSAPRGMLITDLQAKAVWAPQVRSCLRLHTHAGLVSNGAMFASEVFFLLLMMAGIYTHNSGLRAFKIMYREVRAGIHCLQRLSYPSELKLCLTTGSAVACFRRADAGYSSRKRVYSSPWGILVLISI